MSMGIKRLVVFDIFWSEYFQFEKLRKMVIFAICLSLVSAQLDCHWIHGQSGQHVDCLPGFYIDGICGSGSRNDCQFVGNGNLKFKF